MARPFLVLAALALLLSACGGPSSRVMPRSEALRNDQPMEVEVLTVHDGLQHSRDPHISHLIEVRVRSGARVTPGETLTLPYDEWMTGSPPPSEGDILVTSPAAWVRRAAGSTGTASPFWEE